MIDFEALATLASQAAIEAGRMLADDTRSAVLASTVRDIKLAADVKAERQIRGVLSPSRLAVLGEEEGWTDERLRAGAHWVVDGLDGTVNHHYGIPLACVSIALVVDGEPRVGVVYDFARKELFSGAPGLGATLNGKAISVSAEAEKASALLLSALATKRDFSNESLAEFGRGLGSWKKVRMLGSAALSMAYVAAGRADACELTAVMEWDVAAGTAIVRAAGGSVRETRSGEPYVIDITADNGRLGRKA